MGPSIKNSDEGSLVREYAEEQGIGVTEAIARAVQSKPSAINRYSPTQIISLI